MSNNIQGVSSAKALEEHLKRPNYQQMAVENQNKQTEIMAKNSKDSKWQFWAMFIVACVALFVAIIK